MKKSRPQETTIRKRTKTREKVIALVERYVTPAVDWREILLPHLARLASFYEDGTTVQYADLCKDLIGQWRMMQELNPAVAEQMILFGDIKCTGWIRTSTTTFQVNHADITADLPPIIDGSPRATWLNKTPKTTQKPQPTIKPRTLRTRIAIRLRHLADHLDPL